MAHVTFIHGIKNKPRADLLLEQWKEALANNDGLDLDKEGVTSSLVYWADVLYPEPKLVEVGFESFGEDADNEVIDDDFSWKDSLEGIEKDFVDSFTTKLESSLGTFEGGGLGSAGQMGEEAFGGIPLPQSLKKSIMRNFLRDAHHYLFDVEHSPREGDVYKVQQEIRKRFIKTLKENAANNKDGKHVIISHSMGTIIAYDCLKRVPDCPAVDGLLTVGSPLGISEVQEQLKPEWQKNNGFPSKLQGIWTNVFDRFDVVALLDPKLADDYQKNEQPAVIDISVSNKGRWHHDFAEYVRSQQLRDQLKVMLAL